mmetsp:Transcript_8172/g.25174  ORF Transcript_8172/g.25174 Transcript_8172/m.25174 type:complete len:256 (+) Transcript_8172:425-1192(+)
MVRQLHQLALLREVHLGHLVVPLAGQPEGGVVAVDAHERQRQLGLLHAFDEVVPLAPHAAVPRAVQPHHRERHRHLRHRRARGGRERRRERRRQRAFAPPGERGAQHTQCLSLSLCLVFVFMSIAPLYVCRSSRAVVLQASCPAPRAHARCAKSISGLPCLRLVCLSVCLNVRLSVRLSVRLPDCRDVCVLSVYWPQSTATGHEHLRLGLRLSHHSTLTGRDIHALFITPRQFQIGHDVWGMEFPLTSIARATRL